MRVFLTGASGFIGSHVARSLIERGHAVCALAMPEDNLWRLAGYVDQIEFLRCNLQEVKSIQHIIRDWNPQTCIHLAWYAQPGTYLHSKENLNSLQASLELLQIMFESGCEQFIGAGTCAEYEMKAAPIKENASTRPETLYAATKLAFKVIGEQLALQYGRKFSWGRIFYLFGPFEDERRLIAAAIKAISENHPFPTTEGMQVRDYLHVADVAAAFVKMAEVSAHGTYNISSGVPVSVRAILEQLIKISGRNPELLKFGEIPYPAWNPPFVCGDNQRLQELGWKPHYDIAGGLEQVYKWQCDQNKKENGK